MKRMKMKKTALFSRFLEHVLVIKKPFRDAAATMQDPRQHDMIINIIIIVNQDVRQHDHNPRVHAQCRASWPGRRGLRDEFQSVGEALRVSTGCGRPSHFVKITLDVTKFTIGVRGNNKCCHTRPSWPDGSAIVR